MPLLGNVSRAANKNGLRFDVLGIHLTSLHLVQIG